MSKSNSSPQNTTATTTELTTKNLNVSGNTGFTAVGGESGSTVNASYAPSTTSVNVDASNTYNSSTDFGAINAATGLAGHALDLVNATTANALDVVTQENALSTKATSNAYGQALTTVASQADDTVHVISNLATMFGTTLSDYQLAEQAQLGNVVSALNSTYTANNTSANQQVINAVTSAGESSQSVIKYVAIAAVAAVALYFVLRKG